jgi:hypothetical protein
MTQYRPITDMIICARPKVKYYGAYPSGFLRRAKWLMPGDMLHLCGGMARLDPFFGPLDKTLDCRSDIGADFVADATHTGLDQQWPAVLLDPPYTVADAEHYRTNCPDVGKLMREAWRLTVPGGRLGLLHYIVPRPPHEAAILIAVCGVMMGFGNRIRAFTVFQKPLGA